MDSEMKKIEELMNENQPMNGLRTLSGVLRNHKVPDRKVNTEKIFNDTIEPNLKPPFNLEQWFSDTIKRVEMLRDINTTEKKLTMMFQELEKDEYTPHYS